MSMTEPSATTDSPEQTLRPDVRGVAVLANPVSGSGPNRQHVDQLAAALRAAQLEPRLVWEPKERHALLTGGDVATWCRCVVAAGGDGTIADVINEMAQAGLLERVPVATLPIGTENLFAKELGFRRDGAALAAAIDRGHTRRIDLGAAGDRVFTLMASAGFDAEVVHRMARWRCAPTKNPPGTEPNGKGRGLGLNIALRRVNRLSYLPRILSCVREYGFPQVTVEVDGQRHTGSHLFVFNLPQYGGNLGIGRHARFDDAKLDWVLFQKPGLVSLADYALTVIRAKHLLRADVPHGSAARLRVTADAPIPMQTDGDPAGFTPLDVEVRPAALRIIRV